jgi:hypothetical protein
MRAATELPIVGAVRWPIAPAYDLTEFCGMRELQPDSHKLFVTACHCHRRPTVVWIASRVTESGPASGRRLGRALTYQDLR